MRRTILVSTVAVLVIAGAVGGAVYGVRSHQRDRARELLEASTSSFETCLLGDAHPARGNTDVTLRGVRLAEGAPSVAGAVDAGAPAVGPDGGAVSSPWPARCLAYVDPLRSSYERAYAAGATERWVGLEGVRAELAAGSTQHLAELLDALMPFWVAPAPASVPRPVAPLLALLRTSTSRPIAEIGADGVANLEQVQGELHVTLGTVVAACVIDGETMRAACVRPVKPANRVLAHAKGGAILFEQDVDDEKAFVVDGSKVRLTIPSFQLGYAFNDGRVTVLTLPNDAGDGSYGSRIYERTPAGQTLNVPSNVPFSGTLRSAGGWLLWKEVGADEEPEGDARLRARDLSAGVRASTLTLGIVGRRPTGTGHSGDSCESTHLFFDMSPMLAIRAPSGKWSVVPQEARPDGAARTSSCEGDTVRIVDASPTEIRLQECTPARCVAKTTSLVLPVKASVAALGQDDVLVAWPSGNALYALRGKLDDLATTRPFVLIEDDARPNVAPIDGGAPGEPTTEQDPTMLTAMPGHGYVAVVRFGEKTYLVGLKKDGTASAIVDGT